MEKRQIADEMVTLVRQLVAQNQIKVAGLVLQTYFIRVWKKEKDIAAHYVRAYFKKHYPEQLERHLKRVNKVS